MQWMGLNEIREKYLSFFESKEHLRMPSASLVPQGDKSLLLINSGMAPLKPYFTGKETPPRRRVTTCQKCIRTPDIERVGKTARHGTFFEMLGNFSFGDYFKREATAWAWEFCTKVMELPPERLYVSIYENDDEAFDIWTKEVGVSPDHMVRLGKEDNFWEIGSGPCGPCSELYFDRGPEWGCGKPDCAVGCDCDRYIEFWNLVFTQFDGDGNGNYTPLEHPNIDTGMGLERMACIMQNVANLFEVDTVMAITEKVSEIVGATYRENEKSDISLRVITDHIRSTTMMVSDGVMPSNEGRGYVLRRLIRRAVRFGMQIGMPEGSTPAIAKVIIDQYKHAYPELEQHAAFITDELAREEERFQRTLRHGLKEFDKVVNRLPAGTVQLDGPTAFRLYDTYGFPVEMTQELAGERGLTVDLEGFQERFRQHQVTSQAGADQRFKGGLAERSEETARLHTATHLMHAALRRVLGDEVAQKGSNITAERLRFDFSFGRKMTKEEIAQVQQLVNDAIAADAPITVEEMTVDEALAAGAIGLFQSKYGDKVTVYTMGDFSKEICGGPHASHTGELGHVRIQTEESSSSGVRRIKAVLE